MRTFGRNDSPPPFYMPVTILLRLSGTLCYEMATRHANMKTSRPAAPRFFWQGLLIVLPVVVLAGAGLFSIRQDQAMAQREATEKAQAFADQFADILWGELTESSGLNDFTNHTFRIDGQRQLLDPQPSPAVPSPQPLELSALNEPQRQLWERVQAGAMDSRLRSNAIAAGRELLNDNPPTPVAASTQYRLGLLFEADGNHSEANAAFQLVAERYPQAVGEGGLPLATLAEWRRLRITPKPDIAHALEHFCSNVVEHPTFLTSQWLSEAGTLVPRNLTNNPVARWQEEWNHDKALRLLAEAALAQTGPPVFSNVTSAPMLLTNTPPVPKLFWFHASDLSKQPQPVFSDNRMFVGDVRYAWSRNQVGSPKFVESAASTNSSSVASPVQVYPPPEDLRFWLALRRDESNGTHSVICRVMGLCYPRTEATIPAAAPGKGHAIVKSDSRADIGSPQWLRLRRTVPALPAWFGVTAEVVGVPLFSPNDLQTLVYRPAGKGGGQTWQEAVSFPTPASIASASRYEQGLEFLKVNIHLTGPEMLFARQRNRSLLFGGLIAASALAAIIGFISARRAFLRQQQLSEMKSNFVSSVSHELRAPIASVRLLAESLERGTISEPAKQHEYFRFIVQECRRLSSLIENVLDFARIEQGRKQYEFEPTDLPALVHQTLKLMSPAAAEKQVTLTSNLDDPQLLTLDLQVVCDAQAIQQALINLVDNAFKHSPNGETVDVALSGSVRNGAPVSDPAGSCDSVDRAGSETGAPRSMVQLSVTDHGPGIPPEEHERIFDRFYRRGSELRRETQGVGIGLSIVKHIVEAHGGRVLVESEVGHGSRFVLELPLRPRGARK